jgi:hypothetical protein
MPDIAIRGIDAGALEAFRRGASARGMTQGDYLAALVQLHARMRILADTPPEEDGYEQVGVELEVLGLSTVRN